MKNVALYFVTLAMIFQISSLSADESEHKYRILVPGSYHGEEVEQVNDENWFALFRVDSTFHLQRVSVHSRKAHDALIDRPGDSTGIDIYVDSSLPPLLLIQAPVSLPTGQIQTRSAGFKFEAIGQILTLRGIALGALGEVTDEIDRNPYDLLIKNFALMLYDNDSGTKQVLVTYQRLAMEDLPRLIWAGDIDGDYKTDYFLDISNHYNKIHYALFLSCEAGEGEFVKLVAEFVITGC